MQFDVNDVGVSNTAGTLNFIINMKDICIDIIIMIVISLAIICVICFPSFCSYFISIKAITSSPVEEMYHRQLVVTLDSILDARFGASCYKEVIDSDDVSVPPILFRNHVSTPIME
jgi:hypothetical protein